VELEVSAEAKDKRLNRMVAVVMLAIFTGLCNIKDGNIVQAMQQAQSNSVDSWNEYQATKTKLHITETSRSQLALLAKMPAAKVQAEADMVILDADIAKYRHELPGLAKQAKAYSGEYDALNVHDDQFDASEAIIATAISLAAVSALCESFSLIVGSWAFGAFGVFLGVCGFAKWAFHPDILSNFLG
jgi:hypothetical protein